MSNATYTPGPWEVHQGEDYIEVFASNPQREIFNIMHPTVDDEANSILAAAAPELLDALERIIAEDDNGRGQSDGNFSSEAFADARIAIAKARGETQTAA